MDLSNFFMNLLFSLIKYLTILIICYGITGVTFPYLLRMMRDSNLLKLNYKNEQIPSEAGLIFVVLLPLTVGMGMLFGIESFTTINSTLFLFVIIGMGFLGLLDDLIGTNDHKGFRGHFRALLKENRLTSGGFKAIFGAIIAMTFSLATLNLTRPDWKLWYIVVNFLLIVLSANTINLFDLRPGRAGKVFLFGFVLILAFSKHFEDYIGLFIPVVAIMLFYLPYDLRSRVMMGDVGSNLLGATLGVMMAWMLSDIGKIGAILILSALHYMAEKYSFTEIIAKYSWLQFIDNWGRRRN